ncbi:MAG: PAS domain-containing protein [Gemmatimonadetes bacterium]|nr:PAS domain-containing protein [Gemmatimonadota bacterium]
MQVSGPKAIQRLQRLGVGTSIPSPARLLRWVYFWRVALATVVFLAAAFNFRAVAPSAILALAIATIATVVVTAISLWHTHVRAVPPGATFCYMQALFDLALVTTIVHVTGGADSDFSALYILVITVSAVLMPVGSGLLVTLLASLVYFADIVWWHPIQLSPAVGLQIGVFLFVALASGWLASLVRTVGAQHQVLQEEVRRLRLEASDILSNISSGVLSVDSDGILLFANLAAEHLLGMSADDWAGRPFLDLLRDRAPELWAAIRATGDRGVPIYRAEGRIAFGDRSFAIGLTTTALSGDDGRPSSVTATFSDISDQKRLEQLHLRTERLEAVAELSASLAHEIRNPLASIRSSVEQLARSARGNEDERFLAQLVMRESDRLSRILSEFLDFSRVRVTRSRPLNLAEVARAAVDVVREHPECPAGAVITVSGSATSLEGDEDLLHRVVQNLVLNAVQAAGDTAQVRVEVREAAPSELPRGVGIEQPVLLRVSDNGPGIPDDLRDRLFQPFVTGRVGGTGLGLAIVLRAVQAHRGYLLFDSEPGRGTVFTVLFPSKAAAEVAA